MKDESTDSDAEAAAAVAKAMSQAKGELPASGPMHVPAKTKTFVSVPVTASAGSSHSDARDRARKILDPDIVVVPPLPSHGGGSGGNNNSSGDGSSGNNHSSGGSSSGKSGGRWFSNLGFIGTILVGLGVTILFSVFGNLLSIGAVYVSGNLLTPVIQEQVKTMESLKNINTPTKPTESLSIVKAPVTLMTFSCTTEEARDKVFAGENVQRVDGTATPYELSPGCALVKIDAYVSTLGGEKYLFSKVDPSSPTGFTGCGTIGGLSNQPRECVNFLNAHKGQRLRATIADGGYINIKTGV